MEFNNLNINQIMRQVVTLLDNPVKIVLILMLLITIVMIGGLVAEVLQRRYIKIKAAKVVDAIRNGLEDPESIVKKSKMLDMHKSLLLEITKHKNLSKDMIETLAASLLENYEQRLDSRIKKSEIIVKLGPSFGLLGTLIPLGPGIIALSQGDTATLSYSLLAAFDTTVIGLVCGSIATVISTIRKHWYKKDSIMLSLIMEAIVEKVTENK